MATPIKRMMSLRETKASSVTPPWPSQTQRKPKFLKILRRPSFHQTKKHSDDETDNSGDVSDAATKSAANKSLQTRDLEEFRQHHKELQKAVQYFVLVIDKFSSNMEIVMAKIPDNTSIVLESVITINNMLDTCLRLHSSKDLIPHRKAMHKCVADLVKWTDQLLVRGNVKGDLLEGVQFVNGLDASVQELVDLAIPRLRKQEVNEEIRSSIFMFEGSRESLDAGEERTNKRDSGISEGSIVCDGIAILDTTSRPSPSTSRDSGRGSYNYIIDNDTAAHQQHYDGLLSPPEPPVRGRHSHRAVAGYNHQNSKASSKESEWSLSDSSSYKSLNLSPIGSQEEINSHSRYYSAASSIEEGSFYSLEETDHMSSYEPPDSAIIQASYVGSIDNSEAALIPRTRNFHMYIELIGDYKHPSEDILRRPSSAYEGFQENFRRSIARNSPTSPVLNNNIFFRNVTDSERSHSLPILQGQAKSMPSNHTLDWNRNARKDVARKKLLPLEEERHRKGSNCSTSSSSSSSTDEDDSTPALDCLDVARFLVYRDEGDGPTLIGGAIDALIVHASGATKNDLIYYEAFLTTYRTFISPKELINKLLYRERRFCEKGHKKASKNAFFLLLRVVDELTGKVERSILEQLMKEVYRLLVNGDVVLGKILRDKMLPKCENYYRSRSVTNNHPSVPESLSQKYTVLDFHAEDLAKQLTLMDAKNFNNVEIPEILAWGKEQKEELSPNLCIFTEHFNKVSYWCRTHILSFEKQKDREQVYQKFLRIMKHLRRFNNFNAFFGILSALDCSAVRRLNWPKHFSECLAEYATLIDSSSSFGAYREALSSAKPPCIPYLGLILQDVTFVFLGNADELPDGKVNFVKRWQLFNILDTVRRFKLYSYEFEFNDQIAQLFAGMDNYLSEEDLYDKSLKLKPRS